MSTKIAGRTAFITGGANGIGLGIARAFARAGAKVAITDIDADALGKAEAELRELTDAVGLVLDVRDREGFERAALRVEDTLGQVSLLFNNAGVAGGAPADKMSYELWDWGLGVNLLGVINGVQTFLPRMVMRKQGGHIVNTASGAGLAASGSGVLYHTAKYAVVGMAESLALELAPFNIGVSVLCPGPVATDIISRTRKLQPVDAPKMSDEQFATAHAHTMRMRNWLAQGANPDAVGEMVLDAVCNNQLYVHTDRYMAPFIEARAKALLDAMPPQRALAGNGVST
jgi:NAD(P)-dependent dehydrogenase (short-subunit alcohol dehydrogenase family)